MIFADDTRVETRAVLLQLWREKSESARALHGFRLWNSFKNRIMSAIVAENREIDSVELLVETFRRIYRENFSSDELERICARIREYHLMNAGAPGRPAALEILKED
jgi:hypothetical protein